MIVPNVDMFERAKYYSASSLNLYLWNYDYNSFSQMTWINDLSTSFDCN